MGIRIQWQPDGTGVFWFGTAYSVRVAPQWKHRDPTGFYWNARRCDCRAIVQALCCDAGARFGETRLGVGEPIG